MVKAWLKVVVGQTGLLAKGPLTQQDIAMIHGPIMVMAIKQEAGEGDEEAMKRGLQQALGIPPSKGVTVSRSKPSSGR